MGIPSVTSYLRILHKEVYGSSHGRPGAEPIASGARQGLILDFSMSHVFNADGIYQHQHLSGPASRKTRNHRLTHTLN
eukprot:254475-Hanusia_phi.AAC.1